MMSEMNVPGKTSNKINNIYVADGLRNQLFQLKDVLRFIIAIEHRKFPRKFLIQSMQRVKG